MEVTRDITVTLGKDEIGMLRDLVEFGLYAFDDDTKEGEPHANKEAWGDRYHNVKTFGEEFLKRTELDSHAGARAGY